jgi:hypothetical protein
LETPVPRVCYEPKKFRAESMALIEHATRICEEYEGLSLTLRQLYYQFVARGLIANNQANYNKLGRVISEARLAGLFDWDYIVDRTRNLQSQSTWASPAEMIAGAAKKYRTDVWAPQKRRVEVWIEKDAAIGVIERICDLNMVPFFSCRGYTSSSEMWNAANRIGEYIRNGEQVLILHIGDHDPSGLDMTRDIEARLRRFIANDWANQYMGFGMFTRGDIRRSMIEKMREEGSEIEADEIPWRIERIALTIEQIEEYGPPPNYAKESDSRYERYVEETGLTDSWELDALDPYVMQDLIQEWIDSFRDETVYAKAEREQEIDRQVLTAVSKNWDTIKSVHAPKENVSS